MLSVILEVFERTRARKRPGVATCVMMIYDCMYLQSSMIRMTYCQFQQAHSDILDGGLTADR